MKLWAEHGERARAAGRPGRVAYVQNFPVLERGRHLLTYPGFDVCAESTYESYAAIESMTVMPGREELLDASGFWAMTADRNVLVDGRPPHAAVKLMTFFRANPNHDRRAFLDRLSAYADAVVRGGPLRHEQMIINSPTPTACDAIDVIWFRDATEAVDYSRSEVAYEAQLRLAGRAFGTERLIARPISDVGEAAP